MNADYGVAISRHKRKVASAEFHYQNIIFKNTKTGLLLNEYNDYDHFLEGCVFINNDIGIHSHKGHFNVRNSHFFGSRIVDVRIGKPQHPGSVRLCTSEGSNMFFETGGIAPEGEGSMAEGRNWMQSYSIQGCHISNWKNKNAAVMLRHLGPTMFFDNFFSDGPGQSVPVATGHNKNTAVLISSNNLLNGKPFAVKSSGKLELIEIPVTSAGPKSGSVMPWFFKSVVKVPEKVFDAKVDFGAKGNGRDDDSDAIIKTIAAAKKYGKGALAYIPVGNYKITKQLKVGGANYEIDGSGKSTYLKWSGKYETPIVHVINPQNVKISNMAIGSVYEGKKLNRKVSNGKREGLNSFFKNKTAAEKASEQKGVTKILQTSNGKSSSINYDGLFLYDVYNHAPGIELRRLPRGSKVRIGKMCGPLILNDSGQAEVLCTIHFGRMDISGAKLPKTGFTGALYHNAAHRDFALTVRDNQNVVIADFYQEQNARYLKLEGSKSVEAGHVTIGGSKVGSVLPGFITIDNYKGRVWLSTAGVTYSRGVDFVKNPLFLTHKGDCKIDFMLIGNVFSRRHGLVGLPKFEYGKNMNFTSLGNLFGNSINIITLPEVKGKGWLEDAQKALDDFRRIENVNIKFNYNKD